MKSVQLTLTLILIVSIQLRWTDAGVLATNSTWLNRNPNQPESISTLEKFEELEEKLENLESLTRTNSVKIRQLERRIDNNDNSNQPSSISWAYLYDEPRHHIPLYIFNEDKLKNPPCLTFSRTDVDEIDVRGTCAVLYTRADCQGLSRIFQGIGRQNVGALMNDNNLSVGSCTEMERAAPFMNMQTTTTTETARKTTPSYGWTTQRRYSITPLIFA